MKQYKKYVAGSVFMCLMAFVLIASTEKSEAFWPFSKAKKENNSSYTGAVANTGNKGILPVSSITVVSPNGGEILEAGKTYTIKWKSKGISKKAMIAIVLEERYEDMTVQSVIATSTRNTGSYKWLVPSHRSGNNLKVTLQAGKPYFSSDSSDGVFSIESNMVNTPPKLVSVFIRGDNNGGPIKKGEDAFFTVKSFDADNDDLAWRIDWGDGTGMVQVCEVDHKQNKKYWEIETMHIWEKEGPYTISTIIYDCRGGSDKDTTNINVVP